MRTMDHSNQLFQRTLRCGTATLITAIFLLVPKTTAQSTSASKVENARAASALAALPLAFVENQGQWHEDSRFVARRGRLTASLERDGIRLWFATRSSSADEDSQLKLVFENAAPDVRPEGEQRLGSTHNFFMGNDPDRWRRRVPGYALVRYRAIHPGIDLLVHEGEKSLQYDLELAPGADLDRFIVRCEGVDSLAIDEDGRLVMATRRGELVQTAPVAWQTLADGSRSPIDCRFRLIGDSRYGFEADALDPGLALTLDPQIDYATYLGGSNGDSVRGVAVDSQGFIYIAGSTFSTDFAPAATATHGDTSTNSNKNVAFLVKLDPGAQDSLVFSSMFGGTGGETTLGMSLGPFENAVYVHGWTDGTGFPTQTTNPELSNNHGGSRNGFLVCLDSETGANMLYGVLLGGSGGDAVTSVTVDFEGKAHITGFKEEDGTNQISGDANTRVYGPLGNRDAFALVLDATGSNVLASALIGGSADEWPEAIVIDDGGSTYLAGWTRNDIANPADWFPTTGDALKTGPAGGGQGGGKDTADLDGFLVRLDATLSTLEYSTLVGGGAVDLVTAMAFANGQVYLTGNTRASDFPTANPSIDTSIGLTGDTLSGERDAFVTVIDFTSFVPGSVAPNLAFSTYIGGGTSDSGAGIVVDGAGRIHIVGSTNDLPRKKQKEYPQVGSPQYKLGQDVRDGFLTIFAPANDGYSVVYSTLFGGDGLDNVRDLALGPQGEIHLLWITRATDLFTTLNAVASNLPDNFHFDGYVMKIPPPTSPTFGTVSGTVTNAADSSAIAGVLVEADTGEATLTLSDGSYDLEVLAGNRTVTVIASGFDSQDRTVTVTENTTTTADFALDASTGGGSGSVKCITYDTSGGPAGDKHLQITASVVDGSGVPVSGSSVTVDVDLDGVFLLSFSGTTDVSGEVSTNIKNAASGVYVSDVTALTGVTGDPAEPANSHHKGVDPVPDADCNN